MAGFGVGTRKGAWRLAVPVATALGCALGLAAPGTAGRTAPPAPVADIRVTSAAFADRASIPRRYTCEGENLSPPLAWQGVPARARSLALICDDPDAPMGTWVHWVLFNLRASARGLPAAVPPAVALAGGARQGVNGFQKPGYGGPCPPPGKAHRYFFKLYALDAPLALSGAVTKRQLEAAMKGHVLGRGQLVGTYRR